MIQPHDYGRYNQTFPIGSGLATIQAFANFWALLANQFKDNPKVAFSLMNEPRDQNYSIYIDAVNAAIKSIRDTGSRNLIFVQTGRWGSGSNFFLVDEWGRSNADLMNNIVDPLNNIALNMHQYFDSSRGGAYPGCQSATVGAQFLSAVTSWARDNKKFLYLGEFGSSDDQICSANIADTLNFLESNADVWIGWAWWQAGSHDRNSFLSIEPRYSGEQRPQLSWITSRITADRKCPDNYNPSDSSYPACGFLNGLLSNTANIPSLHYNLLAFAFIIIVNIL
jgi:endoglucanase